MAGSSSTMLSEIAVSDWRTISISGSKSQSVCQSVMTSNLMILWRHSPPMFRPPPPAMILKNFLEMNFFFFCYLIGLLKVGHLLTFRERFSVFQFCLSFPDGAW